MCLIFGFAACIGNSADKTASQLVKEAQKAEKSGELGRAYLLYSEAAVKDPENPILWGKMRILRPAVGNLHLETGTDKDAESGKFTEDPSIVGSLSERDLIESRRPLPPPELKPTAALKEFDIRGDSQQLFEQVSKAYGFQAIFDPGYQTKTNLRLQLTEGDYHDAFRALEAASESFVIPLNSHQLLVANDTAQKRTELDRTAAIVIPVPEPFTIQEVQEIATAVRGTLDIQRLMVDYQRRLLLIRDRVSRVRLAEKLIADLMKPKPQVAIEVELLSTDVNSALTYGLSLPNSIPLVWFGQSTTLSTMIPAGFANFLGFGGGKSFLGLGVTNASLFLNASKSNSRTMLRAEVVSSDGQAASLHIGDKYPIVTQGYFGTTTGTGKVYTPPPTFNFEDLGLVLKITPHVHGLEATTLEVEAEFKLLGSQTVDNIPIISNRKFQSKIRLENGEWAVLAGLMSDSDAVTVSGIAGLSVIPVLRNNNRTRAHGETLIVLKPHLLNLPPTESVTEAAWVGTETKPRTAL